MLDALVAEARLRWGLDLAAGLQVIAAEWLVATPIEPSRPVLIVPLATLRAGAAEDPAPEPLPGRHGPAGDDPLGVAPLGVAPLGVAPPGPAHAATTTAMTVARAIDCHMRDVMESNLFTLRPPLEIRHGRGGWPTYAPSP